MADFNLSTEWKQSLSLTDYQAFAMPVSLWDLLFYVDTDGTTYARNTTSREKGYKLPHGVIVFDENLYSPVAATGGPRKVETTSEELWNKAGFDIAAPVFDSRATPLFLTEDNYADIFTSYGFNATEVSAYSKSSFRTFLSQNKPMALSTDDYFYNSSKQTSGYAYGIKVHSMESILPFKKVSDVSAASKAGAFNASNTNLFTVGTKSDSNGFANNDIVLVDEDTSFESRFGLKTGTNIKLRAFNTLFVNPNSQKIKDLFKSYYNFQTLATSWANPSKIDALTKFLLKNCFVVFKCGFFADYVSQKDFGQDLNKSSNVIHRNLILSGTSDFNRYDSGFTNSAATDDASQTRSYVPVTTPSIDLIGKDFYDRATVTANVQKAIDESQKFTSSIGAIPTEPLETYQSVPSYTTPIASSSLPLIWFDPMSKQATSAYNTEPILFPKDGNLITSGRILSPTTDELWQEIKLVMAGRAPSTSSATDLGFDATGIANDLVGYPKVTSAEKTTVSSTRPVLKNHKFRDSTGAERIGDPVSMSLTKGSFVVDSWVNNPESIDYKVLNALKTLANFNKNNDITQLANALDGVTAPSTWGAATYPMSLRELEALLKGVLYNLIYFINYSKKFVTIGGEKTYGTLYQLHKDFNKSANNNNPFDGSRTMLGTPMVETDPSKIALTKVYLSAAGTWQAVDQSFSIEVRSDERF